MAGIINKNMAVTPKKILVTGASGFVGIAVCRALVDAGVKVIGTWHSSEPSYNHSELEWVNIDLSTASSAIDVEDLDFDAVIHLAAVLPLSPVTAEDAAKLNRQIDKLVFRAAAVKRAGLIYASGTSVYGDLRVQAPVPEYAIASPSSPYPMAKLDGEQSGAEVARDAGTRFVALRVCAPYGPGQNSRTVVRQFVENALHAVPLEYYGSGTREQSFTYVSDAANAFVLALRAGSGCYNISGSPPVTMRELALLVADLANVSKKLVRPANRPDPQDGFTARFDVTRAARELGWSPKVSLRTGISRYIEAHRTESKS